MNISMRMRFKVNLTKSTQLQPICNPYYSYVTHLLSIRWLIGNLYLTAIYNEILKHLKENFLLFQENLTRFKENFTRFKKNMTHF